METIIEKVKLLANSSIETKKKIVMDDSLLQMLEKIVSVVITAFQGNRKVLFCGNGGSAADAQHLAAELSGRFLLDRPPLDSEALHVNTSYLTAVANDYSFDDIYSRLVKARCKPGDVIFGLSTSGESLNVINAIKASNQIGAVTVGFTGINGGALSDICNYIIRVPSDNVARIQEAHMLLGHIMCEIVESELFKV